MADDDLKAMLGKLITIFEQTIPTLATKEDLRQVESRLDAKIDATRDQLDAKIDATRDQLDAKIDNKIEALRQELGTKIDANTQRIEAQTEAMRAQAQVTGERIMQDRREISELRGAIDTLGKRFDALVRPAAE